MKLTNFNTYFFFAILAVVTVTAAGLFWPFLSAIFIAALFATMFRSSYDRLLIAVGNRASLSAVIMCFVVMLVIILPIAGIGGIVGGELTGAVTKLSTKGSHEQQLIIDTINNVFNTPMGISLKAQVDTIRIDQEIAGLIENIGGKILPVVTKTYQGVVGGIIWIFVMFFTLFFFFIDGRRFVAKIMDLSPLRNEHEELLIARFTSMARATLKGTLIIGFIQGITGGLAFVVAGVASPMFWTVVMIFLSIIPAVGAGLIIFPMGVIMLALGFFWQGIFLIAVGVFVSSVDNVLRPRLVGKDTQMHSLLVFFGTIGGMSLFGLIGFVVGPIILALALAMWEIYAKEFKTQLEDYNS